MILLILMLVSLGCLGPGKSDTQCEGIVTFNGREYVGKAKEEIQAGLNACNKYVLETDREFDARYGIWLTSDRAKGLAIKKGRQLTKQEAILEDKDLLDFLTLERAVACRKEANRGKHTLKTNCGK